jgi:putative ABC transport system permease protein
LNIKIYLKVILESIRQAFSSLIGNKLRTFLSLLGIAIGIFCIIAVLSAVNSLEQSIKGGLGEMGSDVIIIDVMPWAEDPDDNFWKYLKRPVPSYSDYEEAKERLGDKAQFALSAFVDSKTIKYKSSSVEGGFLLATSYEYPEVQNIEIARGRYLTQAEFHNGVNKAIIGHKISEELFQNIEPLGKDIRMFGQKFQVIGVLKEEGDNPFNMFNYDEATWVGYKTAAKYVNLKENNRFAAAKLMYAKVKDEDNFEDFRDELQGTLRQIRRLRPRDEDNFAMNELSMLNDVIDSIFGVLYTAGFVIGFFALIVGMISVANIMFVSVKERTSIIGVKKALGAKKGIILLEFLIEAIILCIIGGLIGLVLVVAVLYGVSQVLPFAITATPTFMAIGVICSIVVGIVAGLIPAYQASRLDPVVAIRA